MRTSGTNANQRRRPSRGKLAALVATFRIDTMRVLEPPVTQRTSQAVSGVLRAKGFAVDDFEVEEMRTPALAELFGVMGGLLRVRCCSTGEELMYPTGSGSVWLGAFLTDLGRGHFARAARGSGAGLAGA